MTVINQVLAATGGTIDKAGFKSDVNKEINAAQITYSFYGTSVDYSTATISGSDITVYGRPGGDPGSFFTAMLQSYYNRKWSDNATIKKAFKQAQTAYKYGGKINAFFASTVISYTTGGSASQADIIKKYSALASWINVSLVGKKAIAVPR